MVTDIFRDLAVVPAEGGKMTGSLHLPEYELEVGNATENQTT